MNKARRAALGGGVLLAAVLAAACGGSGTTENDFQPGRIIVVGDESSMIVDQAGNANGLKYSVNGTVAVDNPAIDCRNNPIWIQVLANTFGGLAFAQCNAGTTPVAAPPNRIRATFGAKAADIAGQIDAQIAESPFRNDDLVTFMVGVNDVLEQYAQFPTLSEAQIDTNVRAAAVEAARQVNRLADLGAKVIMTTIPDVGYSPYAIAEKAAHTDTDRQAMIIRLTLSFNTALRSTIYNDGRRIGLVLMDEYVQASARNLGLNGYINVTTGVCDLTKSTQVPPSILDCTAFTLVTGGGPTSFLWADDRHLSYGGQLALGNAASSRARGNAF